MAKKICLIPARGGSKRIKDKNIKKFFGKEIIFYSIDKAFKSKLFDKIIDSTNSKNSTEIQLTLLEVFRDLGRTFCFDFRGPIGLTTNLPKAIEQISNQHFQIFGPCRVIIAEI